MLSSIPRIILIYLAILSSIVILTHYVENEQEPLSGSLIGKSSIDIERYGFIIPCPSGTYVILPWNSPAMPLGNPGLKGGILFFNRDTVYFGE